MAQRELDIFSKNLELLVSESGMNISKASREIGLTRVQLQRFLNGGSFPRPDQLLKICRYFNVDERIYCRDLGALNLDIEQEATGSELLHALRGPAQKYMLDTRTYPEGMFQYWRRSYSRKDSYISDLLRFYKKGDWVFCKVGVVATFSTDLAEIGALPVSEVRATYVVRSHPECLSLCTSLGSYSELVYLQNYPSPALGLFVGKSYLALPERDGLPRATKIVVAAINGGLREYVAAGRTCGFFEEQELPNTVRSILAETDVSN